MPIFFDNVLCILLQPVERLHSTASEFYAHKYIYALLIPDTFLYAAQNICSRIYDRILIFCGIHVGILRRRCFRYRKLRANGHISISFQRAHHKIQYVPHHKELYIDDRRLNSPRMAEDILYHSGLHNNEPKQNDHISKPLLSHSDIFKYVADDISLCICVSNQAGIHMAFHNVLSQTSDNNLLP